MSTRCQLLLRTALLSSCALVLAAGFSPAQAQLADQPAAAGAPAGGGMEEIVVTAERRTTNIQKTALAISAIQAVALEKANVAALADINGRIPSLTIVKSSGYETVVAIRGIGYETPENEPVTVP